MKDTEEGVLCPVKVIPRARTSEIAGLEDGTLLVRLHAPPVDGKANQALVEFLAQRLRIRKSQVLLRSGEKCRHKILLIQGVRASQIEALAAGKE